MSIWKSVRLGDVCRVIPGYAFKSRDWSDTGFPVVKIKNIQADCTVDLTDVDCVPESVITPKLDKFRLHDRDILIAMTGATAGKVGKIRTDSPVYLNQRVAKISPFAADPNFVWAIVSSRRYQELFFKLADGAAQPNMSGSQIEGVELDLPDLPTQRRIASILSAYDDLIENNTRRIAILEEMARIIYEEWFVRFRFPGHEQVKMVESELGLIPEGWEITNLEAVSEYINRGLAPKYDDLADGIVINQKCIRGQKLSYELVRRQSKPIPADKRVRYGDVLVNSTGVGTLGRVAQVLDERQNCTVDTHVTIVRPGKKVTTHFYGLSLLAREEYFEQQGVGATGQTELGRGRVAETTFIVPPLVIQEQFDESVAPMRQMTVTLTSKNANLRATRDLLLPKLISGELDVSTLPEPEEAISA